MRCRNPECKWHKTNAPASMFSADSSKSTGRRSLCRKCDSDRRKLSRSKNAVDILEKNDSGVTDDEIETVEDAVRAAGLEGDWQVVESRVKTSTAKGITKIDRYIKLSPSRDMACPVREIVLPRGSEIKRKLPKSQDRPLRGLNIPDIHWGYKVIDGKLVPFHSRAALAIVLQAIREYSPDFIIMHGDNLDNPDWSQKFLSEPSICGMTNLAMAEGYWWLRQMRMAAPAATIVWLEGNHDYRINSTILSQLSIAYDLRRVGESTPVLSIPHLMKLDSVDVEYIGYGSDGNMTYPDSRFWYNKNLVNCHGHVARSKSLSSVASVLEYENRSTLMGHIHRLELASITRHHEDSSKTYLCGSMGTLADIDGPIPRVKRDSNWQVGFGTVLFEPGDGLYQASLHHIFGSKAVLDFGTPMSVDGRDLFDLEQIIDEALAPALSTMPVISSLRP